MRFFTSSNRWHLRRYTFASIHAFFFELRRISSSWFNLEVAQILTSIFLTHCETYERVLGIIHKIGHTLQTFSTLPNVPGPKSWMNFIRLFKIANKLKLKSLWINCAMERIKISLNFAQHHAAHHSHIILVLCFCFSFCLN